jgi:hypothetical protein
MWQATSRNNPADKAEISDVRTLHGICEFSIARVVCQFGPASFSGSVNPSAPIPEQNHDISLGVCHPISRQAGVVVTHLLSY